MKRKKVRAEAKPTIWTAAAPCPATTSVLDLTIPPANYEEARRRAKKTEKRVKEVVKAFTVNAAKITKRDQALKVLTDAEHLLEELSHLWSKKDLQKWKKFSHHFDSAILGFRSVARQLKWGAKGNMSKAITNWIMAKPSYDKFMEMAFDEIGEKYGSKIDRALDDMEESLGNVLDFLKTISQTGWQHTYAGLMEKGHKDLANQLLAAKGQKLPKSSEYKKLATSPTLERLEKYINEFSYSNDYKVDPNTLEITNKNRKPPEKWFVMKYRGGYMFGRWND